MTGRNIRKLCRSVLRVNKQTNPGMTKGSLGLISLGRPGFDRSSFEAAIPGCRPARSDARTKAIPGGNVWLSPPPEKSKNIIRHRQKILTRKFTLEKTELE